MSQVDWEGLKALRVKANAIDATIPEVDRYTLALISEFPAILAQHERAQRVILAADELIFHYADRPSEEMDNYCDWLKRRALLEDQYDKAKQ